MIYTAAGVSATHSQDVTVGAGVVNIVMTAISASDLGQPFQGGGRVPRVHREALVAPILGRWGTRTSECAHTSHLRGLDQTTYSDGDAQRADVRVVT